MTTIAGRAALMLLLLGLAPDASAAEEAKPVAPNVQEESKTTTKPGTAGAEGATAGQASLFSGLYDFVEEIGSPDRPWFLPGRTRGSLGFIYTDQKWDTAYGIATAAGEERRTISSRNRLMTEYFTARYENFAILAPQLANGSLALVGGLQQNHIETAGVPSNQNGTLLGYELALNFIDESPYPSTFYANREKSTTTLPLGGTEDVLVENRGLSIRWLETSFLRQREILPYFNASLQAVQDHTETTTTLAGQRLRRSNDRDIVRLAADNGTETSDLSFRYLLTRYRDRYYGASSYEDQNALFDYSLDFGPNLNWTWFSDVQYHRNSGSDFAASSDLTVQETLSASHYTNLSSYYSYTYTRQDSPLGAFGAQTGSAQVQYAPFNNLSFYVAGTGLQQDLPRGNFAAYGGQAFLYYTRVLPWQGSLNVSGGYGYMVTDTHVPGGTVPVVDAPYVAPGSFGVDQQVLLRDLFVISSTIHVVAIKKDGARLTAKEGSDYVVVAEGYRTYVRPLPTSLVIQPGDPLRISYVYIVPAELKFRTTSRNATVGGSWPWFYFNYNRSETESVPLAGGDPGQLVTFRTDQVDLGINGAWGDFQARADARFYRYDGAALSYRRLGATEFLSYVPSPAFSCNFSASQYQLEYSLPARTSRGQSIQLGFTYSSGNWNANGYALQRRVSDTFTPTERYMEAGIRWDGRWGKLSVGVAVYGSRRNYAGTDTSGLGGQFTVVREF